MLNGKPPAKPVEDLYEEASASVAADTLLTAMGPQLEQQLTLLIKALRDAPPELGALLDVRAKLLTVWDIRHNLRQQVKSGRKAVQIFNDLLIKTL